MHPDKGYRAVRTDVQTDSETIYEAYVRLLNSLHRKMSLSGLCVSLSVLCARGGEIKNEADSIISDIKEQYGRKTNWGDLYIFGHF